MLVGYLRSGVGVRPDKSELLGAAVTVNAHPCTVACRVTQPGFISGNTKCLYSGLEAAQIAAV